MVRVMSANVTHDEVEGEPGYSNETVICRSGLLSSARSAGLGETRVLSIRTKEHHGSRGTKRGSGAYSIVKLYSPRICSHPVDRASVSSKYSRR